MVEAEVALHHTPLAVRENKPYLAVLALLDRAITEDQA